MAQHAKRMDSEQGLSLAARLEDVVQRVPNHMGTTHASIIDGVKQRRPEAPARFHQQYREPIRSYFAATGKHGWGLADHVAEDLADEVVKDLCFPKDGSAPRIKLDTYDPNPNKRSFRPWLFTVLDHRALDYLDRAQVRREVRFQEDSDGRVLLPEDESGPDTVMTDSSVAFVTLWRQNIVPQALADARATEKKRSPKKGTVVNGFLVPFNVDIVVRHYANGESYEDIAQDAGVSVNVVRGRSTAGRQRLYDAIRSIVRAENPEWNEERLDDEIIILAGPLGDR